MDGDRRDKQAAEAEDRHLAMGEPAKGAKPAQDESRGIGIPTKNGRCRGPGHVGAAQDSGRRVRSACGEVFNTPGCHSNLPIGVTEDLEGTRPAHLS